MSVAKRLDPTLVTATEERDKFAKKAQLTGWTLNIAIGVQVLVGSLITGLSAALAGRTSQLVTSVLGGVSTVIASYLARARGSGEPELSNARVKDLEKFIRDIQAFILDHGEKVGNELDEQLHEFRSRLEELLGNGDDSPIQAKKISPGIETPLRPGDSSADTRV